MLDAVLLSRDLRDYVRSSWQIVEPGTPFKDNWHIGCLTEHLQAVSRGEIENLLINIPPGMSKSTVVSVSWPMWEWASAPETRWLFASYDQALSIRDSVKCRSVINSPWYQRRWGHKFKLTGDQNEKKRFENDKRGYRIATSVGGHGTGEHPDRIVIDDPHDPEGATSEAERQTALTWWDHNLSTRGVSRGVKRVVIMQRLHQEDLSAHVLKEGGWVHICLPMRYEPRRMVETPIGWNDPRTEPGELLATNQFPPEAVAKMERRLGAYGTAGQLQQRPSPAEGGMVKRSWWRFWKPKGSVLESFRDKVGNEFFPVELPDQMDEWLQSWDCSVKKVSEAIRRNKEPDPVSGGVWCRKGPDNFLRDRVNERLDVLGTAEAIRAVSKRWPEAIRKLIEDKGNGPAVMQILRREMPGFIPVNPKGSKMDRIATAADTQPEKDARTLSVLSLIQGGNVYLPHPALAPWVWDYIEEWANFPNGVHDDDVDMTSQALSKLQGGIFRSEDEEKARPPQPTSLEEMRARQFWDQNRGTNEADVPDRIAYLNRR